MHKSIYILIIACSFFFDAKAQEKNDPNIDSLVESVKSKYDTNSETQSDDSPSVDSTLTPNQLTVVADTIENWKNLSAFAYAKYLDSLLKLKQQKENVNAPKSSRTRSSSSSSSATPQSEQDQPTWVDNLFTSPITRIVFWTLAVLFIVFVLYKLFAGGSPFKTKTKTLAASANETAEEEVTGESDFDTLIRQSVMKANYRLAIRYQYLKLLHRLANKHFIEMAADKTNYQYVRELSSRGPAVNQQFQNDFASLTLNYEYVWYGEFGVDDVIYNRIARGFNDFNQKI